MRSSLLPIAIAALAALSAAAQAGTVSVNFVEAQRFSDAGRGTLDIERNTQALARHLQKLGQRLPEGQTLQVEVLDLDLAGELRQLQTHELRVLRGAADWPRVSLRYSLLENGREVKSGEERLAGMNYMHDRLPTSGSQEFLAHDKHLLGQWFEKRFMAP